MQKRAYQKKLEQYEVCYDGISERDGEAIHFDHRPIVLPYAEDFPKMHYHDRYELGICVSGDGLFLSDGRFASVSEGDLIFLPPKSLHYSRSLCERIPCYCSFVYPRTADVEAALQIDTEQERRLLRHQAELIPTVIHQAEYPKAAALITELIDMCQSNTQKSSKSVALRLAILLSESERYFPPTEEQQAEKRQKIPQSVAAEVAAYLALHYNESHTAQELAAMCHLSESQLRRHFHAEYQISPIAYRNELRLRIGAELLLRTDLSVAEISERVGYTSPSDFYRAFRQSRGIPPSELRRYRKT